MEPDYNPQYIDDLINNNLSSRNFHYDSLKGLIKSCLKIDVEKYLIEAKQELMDASLTLDNEVNILTENYVKQSNELKSDIEEILLAIPKNAPKEGETYLRRALTTTKNLIFDPLFNYCSEFLEGDDDIILLNNDVVLCEIVDRVGSKINPKKPYCKVLKEHLHYFCSKIIEGALKNKHSIKFMKDRIESDWYEFIYNQFQSGDLKDSLSSVVDDDIFTDNLSTLITGIKDFLKNNYKNCSIMYYSNEEKNNSSTDASFLNAILYTKVMRVFQEEIRDPNLLKMDKDEFGNRGLTAIKIFDNDLIKEEFNKSGSNKALMVGGFKIEDDLYTQMRNLLYKELIETRDNTDLIDKDIIDRFSINLSNIFCTHYNKYFAEKIQEFEKSNILETLFKNAYPNAVINSYNAIMNLGPGMSNIKKNLIKEDSLRGVLIDSALKVSIDECDVFEVRNCFNSVLWMINSSLRTHLHSVSDETYLPKAEELLRTIKSVDKDEAVSKELLNKLSNANGFKNIEYLSENLASKLMNIVTQTINKRLLK